MGRSLVIAAAAALVFGAGWLTTGGGIAPAAAVAFVAGGAALLALGARPSAPAAPDPAADAAHLAILLDGIADPVLVATDGVIAHANLPARALMGAHIVGEDARVALRHPGAAERIALPDAGAEPLVIAGLGGRDRRWEMRVARVSAGQRVVQLIDRSAAHAAERTRVDFVANASHELRTPLAALLGYLETLRDPRGTDPAVAARFLAIMEEEARRMQRLIDDLISLSRIEAEQYRAPAGVVDLAALVRQVCRERRDAPDGRGADLRCEVPDGPDARGAEVAGDAAQLSQLVHNLVGNAMKYGRAGTPVTVAVAPAGEMWRLTVADRGEGVAPEHLPRLTERFYRVDSARSRSLGGTGLGLAIAKHVVERHRGRLEIASEPGVGTTVTALLPAAGQGAEPAADPAEPLSQKGNGGRAGDAAMDGATLA